MARRLTPSQAATRYLEASVNAGATGLAAEHRGALRSQMSELERKYPGTRRRALAGSRRHFSRALGAGEREHQATLREREGLSMGDVERIGRELDTGERRSRASSNRDLTAGPRAASSALGAVRGSGGNIVLYVIGGALFLSLIYLLLTGKGVGALTGIVGALVGGVNAFVAPVDPLKRLETALGAAPFPTSSTSGAEAASEPTLKGLTGGVSASPGGASLKGLFPGKTSYSITRTDAGKDFASISGHIGAIAPGEIVAVRKYSGFGTTIFQKLAKPIAGKRYAYYALETGGAPVSQIPRQVSTGTPIATGTGGVIEVGLSSSADVSGIEQKPSAAEHRTPTGEAFTRALGLPVR